MPISLYFVKYHDTVDREGTDLAVAEIRTKYVIFSFVQAQKTMDCDLKCVLIVF